MGKYKHMIVVRLEGGLGNQLFQYAHAVALQDVSGGRLIFDTHCLENDSVLRRILGSIVQIPAASAIDQAVTLLMRTYAGACIRVARRVFGPSRKSAQLLARFGVYHPFDTRFVDLGRPSTPFAYLHGNFMTEKYFGSSRALLLSQIDLERALTAEAIVLAGRIKSTAAVAVHVRRGDYLNDQWRDKLHICNDDYYRLAIEKIFDRVEKPEFYIFTTSSEDAEWVRENYHFLPVDSVFVDPHLEDVEHFCLMSLCSHFVISNSTFSWWASYLSNSERKLVIAPSPWNRNAWDMSDIYLPQWEVVEVDLTRIDAR